jgi:uncharacterized protein (TIGR03905 family)
MKYTVSGVCSSSVSFDIESGIVKNVKFDGGCNGNGKGICSLAEGMNAEELIGKLRGITCGRRPTSCPDQFARALQKALNA